MAEKIGEGRVEISADLAALEESLKNAINAVRTAMNTAREAMNIKIDLDTSKISEGFAEVGQNIKATTEKVNDFGTEGGKAIESFAKLEIVTQSIQMIKDAFVGVSNYFMDFVKEFAGSEVAIEKLRGGLQRMGDGNYFDKLIQQAGEFQKTTPFSDDEITNAQAMLTTFQLTGEQIYKLTPAMLDLSSAFADSSGKGMDLTQIAILLGKATGAELTGALTRVGIVMTDLQQKQLATAQGMDRVNIMLDVMKNNSNITASALGTTLSGQAIITKNVFDDLKEEIGSKFAPIAQALYSSLQGLIEAFRQLPAHVQTLVVGLGAAATATAALLPLLVMLNVSTGGILLAFGAIATVLGGAAMIAGGPAKQSFKQLGEEITALNGQIEESKVKVGDFNTVLDQSVPVVALTKAQQDEYNDSLARLKDQFPSIVSGIDEKTGKEKINVDILGQLADAEQRSLDIKLEALQVEQKAQLATALTEQIEKQKELNSLQEKLQSTKENINALENQSFANESKEQERIYKLELLNKKHDDLISKLATSDNGMTTLKNRFTEMITSGMKVGNVTDIMQTLENSVKGNKDQTDLLRGAFTNFTSPAVASLLGLNEALGASAELMKKFQLAMVQAKSGELEAAMKTLQEVFQEAQKYKPPPGPGASSKGSSKESSDDPYKAENDSLKELLKSQDEEIAKIDEKIYKNRHNKEIQNGFIKERIALLESYNNELEKQKEIYQSEDNRSKIQDRIYKLTKDQGSAEDEIAAKRKEADKLIENVGDFIQKRSDKVSKGISKDIAESEAAHKKMYEKIYESDLLTALQKSDQIKRLNTQKDIEQVEIVKKYREQAEEDLKLLTIKNSGDVLKLEEETIRKKFRLKEAEINATYSDEKMKVKLLTALHIEMDTELLENTKKRYATVLSVLQSGMDSLMNSMRDAFNLIWDSIFGEAQSVFEKFMQSVMSKLWEMAATSVFKLILNLATGWLSPSSGMAEGAFAEGGYTGDGASDELAGVVHKKEYVVSEEGTSSPYNRWLLGLMNRGKDIGDVLKAAVSPSYAIQDFDFGSAINNIGSIKSGGAVNLSVNVGGISSNVQMLKLQNQGDWVELVDNELIPQISQGLYRIGKDVLDKSLK